jgi:hypothetical protein
MNYKCEVSFNSTIHKSTSQPLKIILFHGGENGTEKKIQCVQNPTTSSVRMKSLIASIESIRPSWFQLQKKPKTSIEQNQQQLKTCRALSRSQCDGEKKCQETCKVPYDTDVVPCPFCKINHIPTPRFRHIARSHCCLLRLRTLPTSQPL